MPYAGAYGAVRPLIPYPTETATKQSAVVAPATSYAFMDAGSWSVGSSDAVRGYGYFYYVPGMGSLDGCSPVGCASHDIVGGFLDDYQSAGRHFDGDNVVFADGHVKWVKSTTIYAEARKSFVDHKPSAFTPFKDNSAS